MTPASPPLTQPPRSVFFLSFASPRVEKSVPGTPGCALCGQRRLEEAIGLLAPKAALRLSDPLRPLRVPGFICPPVPTLPGLVRPKQNGQARGGMRRPGF